MGRGAHLSQEAELQQNLPGIDDEIGDQAIRPTVHAHHVNQGSKKEPPIKPSRRGRPHRII